MYELGKDSVMIGRVVVLPEYRGKKIGSLAVSECEKWAKELGFSRSVVESRDNKTKFYEQLEYKITGDGYIDGDTFRCIRMEKELGE